MKINLKNKIALVTGGGTGIGRYIVKALADSGATVTFTSRSIKSINGTLRMLDKNSNHKGYKIDLSKKGNVEKMYQKVRKDFGSIDILVNNIGHTLEVKNPFIASLPENTTPKSS